MKQSFQFSLCFLFLCSFIYAGAQSKKAVDSLNRYAFEFKKIRTKEAELNAREALSQSLTMHYHFGEHFAYLNLGTIAYQNESYDSSFHFLMKAKAYFESSDSLDYYATSVYNLGIIYDRLRDLERAEKYLNEAYDVFKRLDNKMYQANALNHLGITYGKRANLSKALEYFTRAYELKLELGANSAHELNNIAIVYRKMEEYDKGLEFAEKGMQLYKSSSDSLGVAGAHDVIADLLYDAGQIDSALWHYRQSLEMSRQLGNERLYFGAAYELASLYRREYGNPESAIHTYKEILGQGNIVTNLKELVLIELARIYDEGAVYDSAILYAKKAFESTSLKRDRIEVIKAGNILKRNYSNKGDFQNALKISDLLHLQRDTLASENRASQLSDLRIQLETLEQEKQIELLEKQSKIDSLIRTRMFIIFVAVAFLMIMLVVFLYIRNRNKQRIQELEKANLRKEVERSNTELHQQTIHMMQLNNALGEVENELREINSKERLNDTRKILQKIKINKAMDKDWENFNNYFGNVHRDFYNKLHTLSDDLTQHEGRICALVKMNMNNREIATILNIQSQSAKMAKYRIKKKLNLGEERDLNHFLQRL